MAAVAAQSGRRAPWRRRAWPWSYLAAAEAGLRLVLIAIDNPEYVGEVCAHFERSGFHAQQVGDHVVEVRLDDAPSPRQERLEIALHLRVWEAMNPNQNVKLLR